MHDCESCGRSRDARRPSRRRPPSSQASLSSCLQSSHWHNNDRHSQTQQHHTDTTTTDTHRDPATQHTQCLCFEFTNYETMMSRVLPMNAVLSMWHTMSHLQITRISTIPVDLLSSKMYLIEVWLYFNLVMPRSVALNQLLFQIRSAMQTHDLTRPDPAKIGEWANSISLWPYILVIWSKDNPAANKYKIQPYSISTTAISL